MRPRSGKETCSEIDKVYGHALGALPASEAARTEEHLETCAACRGELETLRPVVAALASWPIDVVRPSRDLWPRLAQRIGRQGTRPESGPRWREPEWREVAPGISCKLLSRDEQSDRLTMMVRLAPGAAYPPHEHSGREELFLLHGELWIDERKLLPGDYNRARRGSADARVWSETGCTCVLVTSAGDVLG